MLIGMDELPRLDRLAEDRHRTAPPHRMPVGMARRQLTCEGLEAGVVHFIEVADGAIHDGSHAADRPHHGAVHLADTGAEGMRPVEVLHHEEGRYQPTTSGATRTMPAFSRIIDKSVA